MDLKKLEKIYLEAKDDYYNNPLNCKLSDFEFDELENQLKSLNSKVIDIVGSKGNYEIRHETPMLSLKKIQYIKSFPLNDWKNWIDKCFKNSNLKKDILFIPKLDGIAIKLKYQNGNLISASTRGNGNYGKNVLNKLKQIVPNVISFKSNDILEVIGEIVIKVGIIDELKNERNYVAGLMNQKNDYKGISDLSFVCFETRLNGGISCNLKRIKDLGFEIPEFYIFDNFLNIEIIYEKFKIFRKKSKYLLDGFVARITNPDLVKELGETNQYPNWAIAIKFEPIEKETIVRNIKWNFTKLKKYVPVLEVDTIEIGKTKISNVNAYNIQFLKDNQIGINSKITIIKSNEITPKIQSVLTKSYLLNIPTHCPICNSKLIENLNLICFNNFCR